MLTLTFKATDESPMIDLHYEHSLISISKWEAFHEKPFFGPDEKTEKQARDYIKFMLLDPLPEDMFARFTEDHVIKINDYINSKQTATIVREVAPARPSSEIHTSEMIYYWMKGFEIPFQPCESWHFNRLMTLIKICSIKETKQKPMSTADRAEEMRRLNAERKQKYNTKG